MFLFDKDRTNCICQVVDPALYQQIKGEECCCLLVSIQTFFQLVNSEHFQHHGWTTTHRSFSPWPSSSSSSSHISPPQQHGNIGLVHNPPAVNVNHLLIGPPNRWKIATGKLFFHKKDMVIPPTHGATRAQRHTNGGIE